MPHGESLRDRMEDGQGSSIHKGFGWGSAAGGGAGGNTGCGMGFATLNSGAGGCSGSGSGVSLGGLQKLDDTGNVAAGYAGGTACGFGYRDGSGDDH